MARQNLYTNDNDAYVYQEDNAGSFSAAVGITDNNSTFRINTQAVLDVTPTSSFQLQIDPAANGNINISPNGSGDVIIESITDGAVISTSGVLSVSNGTDGQLLIGDTGGVPAFATVTSSDSSIVFALGANTFGLTVATTFSNSFFTDSGTATPAAGVLTIAGGLGINTSGAGSTATVSFDTNVYDTAIDEWNGGIIEIAAGTVTSDGVTLTFSVERVGGGDLTIVFSDGFYNWDTTPPATIVLTAGVDTSPQINFVYFLQSTKTLEVSTVSFPAAEHAALAEVLCQSAASLQTDGPYSLTKWTSHFTRINDQGHIIDINAWIRNQNVTWISGVSQTLTITPNGGSPDNVIFTSASGIVLQLHFQPFPAFGGTPDIYTVNDSVTPFNIVTDLNELLTDSTGASMSGRFFSLVIWGVVSQAAVDCKLMLNLPSGSYNNEAALTEDSSRFANFTIPSAFKGTGFLIAQYNFRHQAAAGGTWTLIDFIDLRGSIPGNIAGSATAANTIFVDNVFRIIDDLDSTKAIAFQASGITTLTTRELTVQDADGTIALSGVANFGTGVTSNTAYAVLCGGTTSTDPIQSIASVGTSSQVLTSNGAAALPTFQNVPSSGFTWNEVTITGPTAMVVENGYIANNAGQVRLTLPATIALGERVYAVGKGAGGWIVEQNASQTIHFGDQDTTTGVGGSVAATLQYDNIELLCITANTDFVVLNVLGNVTVV